MVAEEVGPAVVLAPRDGGQVGLESFPARGGEGLLHRVRVAQGPLTGKHMLVVDQVPKARHIGQVTRPFAIGDEHRAI